MIQVSVIIPTRNRSNYVREAIESVFRQSYREYEILVVDDGSQDATRDVLGTYGDRIRYIYQENRGVSAARNRGITEAKGEWVSFLDSDDEWLEDNLKLHMESLASEPDLIAHVLDAALSPFEKGYTLFGLSEFGFSGESGILERPLGLCLQRGLLCQTIVCRKKAAIACGMFEEGRSFMEDYDFLCRLALEGMWGYRRSVQAQIHRRKEEIQNLSGFWETNRTESYEIACLIYERLLKDKRITPSEREWITRMEGEQLRKQGMELLWQGNKTLARDRFRRWGELNPNLKSHLAEQFCQLPDCVVEGILKLWIRGRGLFGKGKEA